MTGAAWTQLSVKFNTDQIAFDAPPTLEVSYLRLALFHYPELF